MLYQRQNHTRDNFTKFLIKAEEKPPTEEIRAKRNCIKTRKFNKENNDFSQANEIGILRMVEFLADTKPMQNANYYLFDKLVAQPIIEP